MGYAYHTYGTVLNTPLNIYHAFFFFKPGSLGSSYALVSYFMGFCNPLLKPGLLIILDCTLDFKVSHKKEKSLRSFKVGEFFVWNQAHVRFYFFSNNNNNNRDFADPTRLREGGRRHIALREKSCAEFSNKYFVYFKRSQRLAIGLDKILIFFLFFMSYFQIRYTILNTQPVKF